MTAITYIFNYMCTGA